jgi:hypothetical protein
MNVSSLQAEQQQAESKAQQLLEVEPNSLS